LNNDHTAGTQSQGKPAFPDNDATQRVFVGSDGVPTPRPQRSAAPRSTSEHPAPTKKPRKRRMGRRDKITIITLISITVLLIAALGITLAVMFAEPQDDGRILKGVIAAGVNLGGMTQDEAKVALEEATVNTYTKLDMTITVLDSTITLSPKDTGARLDIESVVAEAYNYGRTGTRAERQQAKTHALANSYIVPITSYLNLDTEYIRNSINNLGKQFSSTLTQPTITVTGTAPEMGVPIPNTMVAHQTMEIYVGTAEYGLDTNKLYNKVMEYYNINIFQVVGECTVVAPESIEEDLQAQYELLCVPPVDAQIDPVTYDIIPEVYGYGFDLDEVMQQIAAAPYGTTLKIPLTYIEPNITEALLSSNLFKETLAEYSSNLGIDMSWNSNVTTACLALDGFILKSGEVFSFNDVLGELTAERGYVPAMVYAGKRPASVIGGGVSHVASVLFNCILQAGLEPVDVKNHTYVTSFMAAGQDVYVDAGKVDFTFRNSLPDPIRITAKAINGSILIQIIGTDNRDYRVEVESLVVKTKLPGQLHNYMQPGNPGGYEDGQILLPAIIGYDVEIYRYKYSKESGQLLEKELLLTADYEARDAVVVKLQTEMADPTDPTDPDPTDPSNPTDPSESDPTEPSESDPTEPSASEGTDPTDDTETA